MTLESLCEQDVAAPWEVVVVDNRSVDRSSEIALSFADVLRIRVVSANALANEAYARNVGVQAAGADAILFLDSDDTVSPSYVRLMAEALEQHHYVTSSMEYRKLNEPWLREVFRDEPLLEVPDWFGYLPSAGANSGISRKLYEEVGGFPEEYVLGQDLAFTWRAQLRGFEPHLVPDAVYSYRFRSTFRSIAKQQYAWGKSLPQLYAEFAPFGMSRRSFGAAAGEWAEIVGLWLRARSRVAVAKAVVRSAYASGLVAGSLKHRVRYL